MDNDKNDTTPVKTSKLRRIMAALRHPKIKRSWLLLAALVVVLGGAGYGIFAFYNQVGDLNGRNAELQKKVSSYQKLYQNAENSANVQTPTPLPTNTEDNNGGGTALQVNTDPSDTKKYLGGEYAPYWLLNPYAVTIPNGVKMQRSTYTYTNGQLFPYDNEGGSGCYAEGIIMSVTSNIHIPGSLLGADGSSATYQRGVGCGGGDLGYVAYAKYYEVPGITDHEYKYMEVVFTECKAHSNDWDADTAACGKSGGSDTTKWTLYSGLVQNDAEEFTKGQVTAPVAAERELYNRDAKEVTFRVRCPSDDGTYVVNCNDSNYKNTDYNAVLNDAAYKTLRGIITGMHQTK